MKRKLRLKEVLIGALVLCLAALLAAVPERVLSLSGEVAFLSAATLFPAQAVDRLLSVSETTEREPSVEVSRESEPSSEDTTATERVEPSTKAVAQKKDTPKEKEALTDTPEDIKKLIEAYRKKSEADKKDGAIRQEDYHEHSKTDSFGRIHVKNTNKTKIDIEKKLSQRVDLTLKDKDKPYVLIIHSHTTEAYQVLDRDFYAMGYKTRSSSPSTNVARVGAAVTRELEQAGYKVVHDETIYDTSYSGAYPSSRAAIKRWMEKYPTIQIVLDLHRDAIQFTNGTKLAPTALIEGKKAAQIMIISGCMEEDNGVEGFTDWQENLTFAVHLQQKLETMYEGITRPILFSPRKYNMDMTHCSLLVEMGSDGNTLEQAVYSGKMLGRAVASMLKDYS